MHCLAPLVNSLLAEQIATLHAFSQVGRPTCYNSARITLRLTSHIDSKETAYTH